MMVKGKSKPNQKIRTKGNVKPSSSDRASEFLQRNAFDNLSAFPNAESSLSSQPLSRNFSSLLPLDQDPAAFTLDVDFLATLRRLEKRNSATKCKALNALISLLRDQNQNGEYKKSEDIIVSTVLPFWPRLYNGLAYDEDRRVREFNQIAMHALAKRLGRKVGYCLKHVVISWTFATVDSYENTARAARIGLSDTFPGNRTSKLYQNYARYFLDEFELRLNYLVTELPEDLKFKESRCPDASLLSGLHHYIDNATQFIAWVASLLPGLSCLPSGCAQLLRLYDFISRLCRAVPPILDMAKSAPLRVAYLSLISTTCKSMTEWLNGQEELLQFIILKCVKEIDLSREKLAAAHTCVTVFGEKVWSSVDWIDLINSTIIPMIQQIQAKSELETVYVDLPCLVYRFPLEQMNEDAAECMEHLMDSLRKGLIQLLNLSGDVDLRLALTLPKKYNPDHCSRCLNGLLDLSRYLLRIAVLTSNQGLVDFLLQRIFLDFLAFIFFNVDAMNQHRFSDCLFHQTWTTLRTLADNPSSQFHAVLTSLQEGITELIKPISSQELCPCIEPLLDFLDYPANSGSNTIAPLESWCQLWLSEILTLVQPTSSGGCVNSPQRWLLTFNLIGRVDSYQSVDDALSLLLTSVVPFFDDVTFLWSSSMSRGLAKCSLIPIPSKLWLSASTKTRKAFLRGPIEKLFCHASFGNLMPVLSSLIGTLTTDIDSSPDILLELTRVIFFAPSSCIDAREQMLRSICTEIAKRDHFCDKIYEFLSSIIRLCIDTCKLSPIDVSNLLEQYIRLTIDGLWLTNEIMPKIGEEVVHYLDALKSLESCLFSRKIWLDVLAKLKSNGCPRNSAALLEFFGPLFIKIPDCKETWLNHIVTTISDLSDQVDSASQNLPIFVCPEIFPMHFLPLVAPIIVVLQIGLKSDFRFTVGSLPHKQLANVLLILHFWLSVGTIEPYTLDDLSPNMFFMPTDVEDPPSVTNLLRYLDGLCSELADSVYSLEQFDMTNAALRAALSKRLVDVHPLQWPPHIQQAASCSPPVRWLEEQVIESSSEVFLRLCEVYLPVGVLRRCLPRSGVITHVLTLSSKEHLEDSKEGLARLVEFIASLSSINFVGCSYAFSLASLTLEEAIREPLVDIETWDDSKMLRAVTASMKILQVLVLLRQPAPPLENIPHLGLAVLSLHLRQTKPRLTREQWDSLLCLTASWIALAVARPVRPTAFPIGAFRLVAAIGALFVNSVCSSTTIVRALIRRDMAEAASINQLMDMSREEWDETDFDLVESYDCEDDGTMPPMDMQLFDWTEVDDVVDADTKGTRYKDPDAQRRLAPPVLVQKDWNEFFACNIYGSLICLAADLCLYNNSIDRYHVSKDTPAHLTALCAAVATCSVETLFTCLERQPDIVVTFLLNIPTYQTCHSPKIENNLFSSKCLLAPHTRNIIDFIIRFLTTSPYQAGQLLGHILLTRLVASRSLEPARRISDVLIPLLPSSWVFALTAPLPEDLETILSDGDTVVSQWGRSLFTVDQLLGRDVLHGHQRVLTYLLAWDAVVSLLSSASQQSRAGFQAALLKDETWTGHLCRLLLTLGLLLPTQSEIRSLLITPCRLEPDPRLLLISRSSKVSTAGVSMQKTEFVFAPPDALVHLPGHRLTKDLPHLAIRLLHRLLSESPALMRSLYAELQRGAPIDMHLTAGQMRQLSGHLERVVRRHFSIHIIAAEVESIERKASEFKRRLGVTPYLDAGLPDAGSVDIKGRPLSREIVTTYHFSTDQSIEMIISLPENFPLSPVTVETGHKTGSAMSNWRAWIVHLSVFINNQNGSIVNGIGLWLRNLKKKFDGVEHCAICYSVIHDSNFSFPRMQCRVCKKRFHNECMYRYFQTSRNPTCPLCRSLFYATG